MTICEVIYCLTNKVTLLITCQLLLLSVMIISKLFLYKCSRYSVHVFENYKNVCLLWIQTLLITEPWPELTRVSILCEYFWRLDSKFTMLMIKSEIFHFCSLQVTFCFKKNIFWIPFMHSIHSLSQFYKEPIYVADSLVKISVEVRAT